MEWYYVWWHWLTYKRVAQVCQHQLIFLSIILSNRHIFRRFLQKNLRQYLQRLLVRNFFYTPDYSVKIQSYCMHTTSSFTQAPKQFCHGIWSRSSLERVRCCQACWVDRCRIDLHSAVDHRWSNLWQASLTDDGFQLFSFRCLVMLATSPKLSSRSI